MTHAAQLDAAETNEKRIHAKSRPVLPPLNHPPSANMAGVYAGEWVWKFGGISPGDATQCIAFIKEALATGLIDCKITGFQNVPAILVMKIDRLLRQVTTRTSGSIDAALSTFYHINTRTITPIHDESFTTILGFCKLRPDHSWMNSNDFSSNATTFHLPCEHNACQARIGIRRESLALEGRIRRTIRYGIDVASDPHNALRFQEEIQHVMAQNTSSLFLLAERMKTKNPLHTQKKIRNETKNMNTSKRLGIFPDA